MNTPSSRKAERNALAAQVAAFSGSIEQAEGFERIEPLPERKSVIDPKTKLKMSRLEANTYVSGVTARDKGLPKIAPGSLSWGWLHWWLAGWNDRDMELVQ